MKPKKPQAQPKTLPRPATTSTSAKVPSKTSSALSSQLLEESRRLEAQLKTMAQQTLSANEAERKKMSLQLNEEIAQTLLGIHVRLLALKQEVAHKHLDLAKEIAATQRLVRRSVKIVNRLAVEYGVHPELPLK